MKRIILIFVLLILTRSYSQNNSQKRELLLIDGISILSDNVRLYVNVKTNKPVHFQIWNGNKLVLNAEGSAKGEEFFPVMKGRYKFILFDNAGRSKMRYFRI
jgi:hypothetical protein